MAATAALIAVGPLEAGCWDPIPSLSVLLDNLLMAAALAASLASVKASDREQIEKPVCFTSILCWILQSCCPHAQDQTDNRIIVFLTAPHGHDVFKIVQDTEPGSGMQDMQQSGLAANQTCLSRLPWKLGQASKPAHPYSWPRLLDHQMATLKARGDVHITAHACTVLQGDCFRKTGTLPG